MAILRCLSIRKIWYLVELENKTAIGIGLWWGEWFARRGHQRSKTYVLGNKDNQDFSFLRRKSQLVLSLHQLTIQQSSVFGSSGYVYVKKGELKMPWQGTHLVRKNC